MKWPRYSQFICAAAVYAALAIYGGLLAFAEQTTSVELPIYATEAQNGYQPMLASAGPRQVYLLGDASHGTEEYYSFRRQVTQHLIREYGVRSIILEEEWDSMELINRHISGHMEYAGSTKDLLNQVLPRWPRWLWNNNQMVGFIDWLKAFNRNRPEADRVQIYGMDMKDAILPSVDRLKTLLPTSSEVSQELDRLETFWNLVLIQPPGEIANPTEVADAHFQITLSLSKLGGLIDEAQPVLERLEFANRYYQSYRADFFQAWNIRSEFMAGFVLAHTGSSTSTGATAVWAHNNHVGDKSADDVRDSGLINMGQLVRERLGKENVFILGSASYQGEVLAARDWQSEGEVQPVAPAREHSVERIIFQWQWDNPLLYWDSPRSRELWSFDVLHRGIGAEFDSAGSDVETWVVTDISQRYDALVFWKRTRALETVQTP